MDDQVVNFTVLDVNAGSETREAEAFIAAYAKNGNIAGEYASQAQALDKAFELCPRGVTFRRTRLWMACLTSACELSRVALLSP